MVIITFPDGSDWFKANWAFRQLAHDTSTVFPDDATVFDLMEKGEAFGHLALDAMDPDCSDRVMRALMVVGQEITNGDLPGWLGTHPGDADGQRMYLEAVRELLEALGRQTRVQ
jgi:acetyl-CoA acetyltransferase